MFLAIRERAYRVRPQVKVGSYRIDLVVEGGTRRLAVECDGDAFHGEDEALDDAARQRDLERVGWTFCRVRGSTFFRDPQAAMEPLWELLDRLSIEPAWELEAPEAPATEHTEVEATAAPVMDTATDVVAELLTAAEPTVVEPPQVSAVATAPRTRPAANSPSPKPIPRFRNGKMLLTQTAHRRVEREITAIEAWLADPPPIHAVDARSRDVQQAKQEAHRDDLEGRLGYLRRVLSQSVADPQHPGGQWVTPGCIVGLLHAGDEEIEHFVVTSMPDHQGLPQDVSHVSPFTELAHAIDSMELGATVRYETPRGGQRATVAEILD